MSVNTTTADVFLDFGGKRHTPAPLVFTPFETKVVSVTKLLGDLDSSPSEAPEGGITIVARGTNPKLIAQGRVLDPVTGFSTTLEFPDAARQTASALQASGLPVGTPPRGSPYAGTGSFTPHVVVRNLLPTTQTVTVTVEYPAGKYQAKGPGQAAEKRGEMEFDGEAGESTEMLPLGPFSISGFSTQDISLDAAIGQLPLPLPYCSLRVQYSGAPGTMVAQLSSVDQRQDLVVDARAANEGDSWLGSGANPWHLDDQTESVLFLTNESDKPARIGFSVTANGVHHYLTSLRLSPHETRAIDFRKLRDAQLEDFKGNRIPASAADGSVNWIRLDNVAVTGRVMVISRHGATASNYDCCICPCAGYYYLQSGSLIMTPSTATILAGNHVQIIAKAWYEDCNGYVQYFDVTGSVPWYSSNTSVATVSAGNVTGQGGGTANITTGQWSDCTNYQFDYTYCSCSCSSYGWASGSATVHVGPHIDSLSPTHTMVGSDDVQIQINGKGFGSSPSVNLPSGFTLSGTCDIESDTRIVVCLDISVNRAIQSVSLSVTTAQGTSNSTAFLADGPNYMLVVYDVVGSSGREVEYQVFNMSGSLTGYISIGESASASGWNCIQPNPGLTFEPCGGAFVTPLNAYPPSAFIDTWSFPDGYTPVGCGVNITDHWRWCGLDAPIGGHTFGTLSGYLHNDASKINGYVNPPSPMPSGFRINP